MCHVKLSGVLGPLMPCYWIGRFFKGSTLSLRGSSKDSQGKGEHACDSANVNNSKLVAANASQTYRQSSRLDLPQPHLTRISPKWNYWLVSYQETLAKQRPSGPVSVSHPLSLEITTRKS